MVKEHIGKIQERKADSHKGDYGRVLVVAGSPGMTGAAYLCAQGALKSGSGLVTTGIPESLNQIMEIKLTEVMTLPLLETPAGYLSVRAQDKILEFAKKCNVVALGPGIGEEDEPQILTKGLLKAIDKPLVLDADGINALGGDLTILKERKARSVLTPHPGEMARLTGKSIEDVQADREGAAKVLAEQTGAVVCLKGHKTVVASPDGKVYTNDTGNSGMATGGSGDVLTGMITSFIGQGIDDYSAAISAVYIHGLAGDIAAERKGTFSMSAVDILSSLGEAFDKAGL